MAKDLKDLAEKIATRIPIEEMTVTTGGPADLAIEEMTVTPDGPADQIVIGAGASGGTLPRTITMLIIIKGQSLL